MAKAQSAADFLAGIAVSVDPTEIERELAALWKPAAEDQGGEGAVVRACLANLVVYIPGEAERERAAAILPEVSRRHPNRTILLVVDDGADAGGDAAAAPRRSHLSATATAVCYLPAPGAAAVCCEQIALRARRGDAEHFLGAVAPLLVPDIPVFLWWMGDYRSPLLPALVGSADRIIVDSRAAGAGSCRLAEICRVFACGEVREVADLSWRALDRWRQAVADIFDDPPARALVPEISAAEVEVAPGPSGAADAIERAIGQGQGALLAGWLASRLGWSFDGVEAAGEELLARFARRDGRPARLRLAARRGFPAKPLSPGEPAAVRLSARADPSRPADAAGEEPFVSIEIDPSAPRAARIAVQAREVCLLPEVIPFSRPTSADLLGEVLNTPVHPRIFREAAEMAAKLVESR